MHAIFAAGLLASIALANPLGLHPQPDLTNVTTIHARQDSNFDPFGTGQPSGIKISTYPAAKCKEEAAVFEVELAYYKGVPTQMQSYHLSDDLSDDDILGIYADIDYDATAPHPADSSLNGNTDASCAQALYNAEGGNRKAGCHTLPTVVGCAILMLNESLV